MNRKLYTNQLNNAIMISEKLASDAGAPYIETDFLLAAMMSVYDSVAARILADQNVDYEDIIDEITHDYPGKRGRKLTFDKDMSNRTYSVMKRAEDLAVKSGSERVGTIHVLAAMLEDPDTRATYILDVMRVNLNVVKKQIVGILGREMKGNDVYTQDNSSSTPLLDKYGRDLTRMAREGRLDKVIGRENEVERTIQILSRRTKNNPCLIGEPGVGKTAVVEAIAQRINEGTVPSTMMGKRIINLEMSHTVAGTKYRGEFEERMTKIMDEVEQEGDIILFIDEIHTIIGTGGAEGSMDASNMLKPALAKGTIKIIGATTITEYRKYFEKDAALERRFQPVRIEEPTEEETIEILKGIRNAYEDFHNVSITDEAVEAAVKLSVRYITDRNLPDKAIDLIDEACSRKKIQVRPKPRSVTEKELDVEELKLELEMCVRHSDFKSASAKKKELDKAKKALERAENRWHNRDASGRDFIDHDSIAKIVSMWTGVPVAKLGRDEQKRLVDLEKLIHKRVVGQQEAIEAVSKAVRRGRVGLNNPGRPIGSFMFLGPTGVGKTELSKALAEAVFGSEDAIIRVDMSEYMESHTVSKMIGSPPGYVGYEESGGLTEQVRKNPYSVVLFDELEKAHPDVINILLQILDDGHITDSKGRRIDFKNTIIIMTSNVGARFIVDGKHVGFGDKPEEDEDYETMKKSVMDEVNRVFRPEFLNRIDEILVFHALTKEETKKIVGILLRNLDAQLREQMDVSLKFTAALKNMLAAEGYDKKYGARPLRRLIQKKIEDMLSDAVLLGDIKSKDKVTINYRNGEVGYTVERQTTDVPAGC